MWDIFSDNFHDILRLSREEALRLGHNYMGAEHFLLGILREGDGITVKTLRDLGVDILKLKKAIEEAVPISGRTITMRNIPLTEQAENILKTTKREAKFYKSKVIDTEHLLLSLMHHDDNIAAQLLHQFNVHYDDVKTKFKT